MSAHLFIKLAEGETGGASPLPGAGPLTSPGTSLSGMAGNAAMGGLNMIGHGFNRLGRLSRGTLNMTGAVLGQGMAAPFDVGLSAAKLVAPKSWQPGLESYQSGMDSFHDSMRRGFNAGAVDVNDSVTQYHLPQTSASALNSQENAEISGQSHGNFMGMSPAVQKTVTHVADDLAEGAADALPSAMTAHGISKVLGTADKMPTAIGLLKGTRNAVTNPTAAVGAVKTVTPLAAASTAGRYGATYGANMAAGIHAAVNTGREQGLLEHFAAHKVGLGPVVDTAHWLADKAYQLPYVGQPLQLLSNLAPGAMKPFIHPTYEKIDSHTGQIVPNPVLQPPQPIPTATATNKPAPTPPAGHNPDTSGQGQSTLSNAYGGGNMPTTPPVTPANSPNGEPPDVSKMFSHLATQFGQMDPSARMAILAGGGLGITGLMGGGMAPLMGLALAGYAAHQGMMGDQAKNMMQGFGSHVQSLLGQSGHNPDASGQGQSTLSKADSGGAPKSQAAFSPIVARMRAEAEKGDDSAAQALAAYEKAHPEIGKDLKQLDSYSDSAAAYGKSWDPAWKGITATDMANLRRIRAYGKEKGYQISHNVPARTLDPVDRIRNSVNVNGNIPDISSVS